MLESVCTQRPGAETIRPGKTQKPQEGCRNTKPVVEQNRVNATKVLQASGPRKDRAVINRPHPSTGDPDYSDKEQVFLRAIHNARVFVGRSLTQCETLKVIEGLGFVQVAPRSWIVAVKEIVSAA